MEEQIEKEPLWERLQNTYRLTVMNDETFEEVGTYQLSLWNVYVALSVIVVIVAFLVVMIMAFTPAKRIIPGFDTSENAEQISELTHQIDSLEALQTANEIYINAFRNRLEANVQTADDLPANAGVSNTELIEVEESPAIDVLKKEVAMNQQGNQQENAPAGNIPPANIPLEQMYFTPPLTGNISAGFLATKDHYGIDIVAPKNTAVKAVMDGWVISSDWTVETGNTIGIQHTNDIITWYKHNSTLLKNTGSYVKAGEAVAIIGNTGELTDGPHLHFELWHRGKAVDPEDYINFN